MNTDKSPRPIFPRRAFVAAALSALFAGSAVGLATLGKMSSVQSETFQFSRGVSLVAGDEARLRGLLASALADDRFHITVLAHTGVTGDTDANLNLSQERADLVSSLARELGVEAAQITARGLGGGAPLPKIADESDRAYQVRLARVEVSLQMRK